MKLNLDSPVLDYVNTLLSYIVLNLLFILCCIPVITIGPAVAALYAVMLREARREYGYLYRSFLRAFREMFFQALGMSVFFVGLVRCISFSVVLRRQRRPCFIFFPCSGYSCLRWGLSLWLCVSH